MTIDQRPPCEVAEDIFYQVELQGRALEALSELILLSSSSKITESTVEGIGRMLGLHASKLLETAMEGGRVCQPPNPFA